MWKILLFVITTIYGAQLPLNEVKDSNNPALNRRLAIMHPLEFTPQCFEAKPKELFFEFVKQTFEMTNRPYETRRDGVFYREDYIREPHTLKDEQSINWCANVKYFNLLPCGFCVQESACPSDALQAFFKGPTIADCQTVCQIAYWWGLLNILGSDAFDKKFKLSCLPFYVNAILSDKGIAYKEKLATTESPFYFFMEQVQNETDLKAGFKIGDFFYIQGHPRYKEKHPAGSSPGWNVVYVEDNDLGEPLFTSFSALKFRTPKTYKQIITYLVNAFNDPMTHCDIAIGGNSLEGVIAKDEDIIGFMDWRRFNLEKASSYSPPLNFKDQALIILPESKEVSLSKLTDIQKTNMTFDSYKCETKIQQEMFDIVFKFANASSGGLILTSEGAIGKTHLAIAVVQYSIEHGNRASYFCMEKPIEELEKEIQATILSNPDVIILDHFNLKNSFYFKVQRFFVQYALKSRKKIMIASKEPILNIYDCLDEIYKINDERVNFFVKMHV
ncbi:MAG: ATP-binding protein [Proteobacteria bacterium]|nr:ATP-binding protein [Pseudomonadota bacterium]